MSEIDWSKAPEGATHYQHDICENWLKRDGNNIVSYWSWGAQRWYKYANSISSSNADGLGYISKATPKPVSEEWNGNGLPPVGVECEYRHEPGSDSIWFKCEIKYIIAGDGVAAWCPHLECEQWLGKGFIFRPIKSEKDKAVEVMEKLIDYELKIKGAYTYDPDIPHIIAKTLYKDGYRKP